MKPVCKIRPAAQTEIDDLAEYISVESPHAAEQFLIAIEELFQNLVRMPRMGQVWESSNPQLTDMRIHTVPGFRNYLVFYRPIKGGIEVFHVFHGARDICDILENLDE